ncbi:MAG TPA: hypothetical protein PLE32_25365, partial [Haliscomenobacter sp.]|nr:hypothetical protein [Haliscomenobacter sp.]
FLSGRFGINNRHLPNARLQPGQEVWMTTAMRKNAAGEVTETTRSIGLSIDQAYYDAGISEQIDYIKLIVAKQDFDTTGFNQEPLLIRGVRARTRDSGELPIIEEEDWTTQRIPIRIVRPQLKSNLIR